MKRPTTERAVKPTSAQLAKLFNEDSPSTSIEDGLTHHNRDGSLLGAKSPTKSAEQIRAEARSRDPESWKRAERMRTEKFVTGREAAGDRAEVLLRRMTEAVESGNEALILGRGREFYAEAPQAFGQFLEQWDELVYREADELGLDADDDDYPGDEEMPSFVLGNAVREAHVQEQAAAQLAHSSAMISGLVNRNESRYLDGLTALGISDDPESVAYYRNLSAWIAGSTGLTPGELASTDPEAALDLLHKGHAQLAQVGSDLRTRALHESLLAEDESTSVLSGMKSGQDEQNDLIREQNDLLRAQLGQEPEGWEIPAFDPELDLPGASEEEVEQQTAEEIKASLLEPEEDNMKTGFTKGGEPVTFEEASRNIAQEEAAERTRTDRLGIV